MTPSPAYCNVHGQPVDVSARDAVIAIHPEATAKKNSLLVSGMWIVRRTGNSFASIIGTGATEEAAWREAWSRILAEEVAKEGR